MTYQQAIRTEYSELSAQAAGILQGCRMLGFPESDAVVVKDAWQKQSQRLGRF